MDTLLGYCVLDGMKKIVLDMCKVAHNTYLFMGICSYEYYEKLIDDTVTMLEEKQLDLGNRYLILNTIAVGLFYPIFKLNKPAIEQAVVKYLSLDFGPIRAVKIYDYCMVMAGYGSIQEVVSTESANSGRSATTLTICVGSVKYVYTSDT